MIENILNTKLKFQSKIKTWKDINLVITKSNILLMKENQIIKSFYVHDIEQIISNWYFMDKPLPTTFGCRLKNKTLKFKTETIDEKFTCLEKLNFIRKNLKIN